MNKRYKITIEESQVEEVIAGQEWKEGAGISGTHGYTPEITKRQNVTRTIYTQNVDDLSLQDVIKAVNGL